MFILDCVVNFYDSVEVPERVLREPAYCRFRARGRLPSRLKRSGAAPKARQDFGMEPAERARSLCTRDAMDQRLNEALEDLFARWERDELEGKARETKEAMEAASAEEVDVP